jgi:predicted PurR-regulated permease PerM
MVSDAQFIKRVMITVGLVILAFLLLVLLYFTFDVVLLIFSAVLIAILLRGFADLLGRYIPLGGAWLVLLAAALLVGALAAAIALLAPSVADQAAHLRDQLPISLGAARDYIAAFGWGRAILEQLPDARAVWDNITSAGSLSRVGGIFSSTLGAIGNFFIVILLAIYFAIEPKFYADGFARLFPIDDRPRVLEILESIAETLQWWLIGKAGSMIFIGVLTWIALSILGIPLALTLGLIAGLLSFIPNFGPILSAVPAILIGFIISPMTAVYAAAIFVGVQLIESNIVTPLIERETIELPPGLTVIFQLALAVLVGGLGLVLATPLLAVVMVVVQMVYMEDVLGDKQTDVHQKGLEVDIADAETSTVADESAPSE